MGPQVREGNYLDGELSLNNLERYPSDQDPFEAIEHLDLLNLAVKSLRIGFKTV